MKQTFYSNGKLLITGEYLVLDGARAFALPTKFGQNLTVEKTTAAHIHWISYDNDGSIWFEDFIPFSAIIEREPFDVAATLKNTLIDILHEAYLMNSDFITKANGYRIITQLTFPKSWGLGTSSTLINNIAQWLQIDAFELLNRSFGGSGYDIACAQNNSGIIYQLVDGKPTAETIAFHPSFTDKIYFIYLNKKQNSKAAIASYRKNNENVQKAIPIINSFTKELVEAIDEDVFAHIVAKHETVLSAILDLPTIKETLFQDFDGVIKSLGAWGGDFVMSISKENPTSYFNKKGFPVVIPYEEMIL